MNDELYRADTLLVPPSAGHTSAQVKFIGVGEAAIRPILPTEITFYARGAGRCPHRPSLILKATTSPVL